MGWKDRTCTGCHQACSYGRMTDLQDLDWDQAYLIRFRESVAGAKRGEYGKGVRATRGRILGLLHQSKKEAWAELIADCPERLYPPPRGEGVLDFDASDADEAAEVAAAQAVAMETPIKRGDLEAQLGQAYARDKDEWEALLADEYRAELEYRRAYGIPRPLPQPEALDVQVEQHDEPGGYW